MNLPTRRFLERQLEEAARLAEDSDLVEITPIAPEPVQHYLVRLHTRGLVKTPIGGIEEAAGCAFSVYFASDYLCRADRFEVVQWIGPQEVFLPNVGTAFDGRVLICVGDMPPGAPLVDLIEQVSEIWGGVKAMPSEYDALNRAACQWARRNPHRFPIDARPLRRAAASVDLSALELEVIEG